jgi:hypothetical protein
MTKALVKLDADAAETGGSPRPGLAEPLGGLRGRARAILARLRPARRAAAPEPAAETESAEAAPAGGTRERSARRGFADRIPTNWLLALSAAIVWGAVWLQYVR